jgi:hypothetical protein
MALADRFKFFGKLLNQISQVCNIMVDWITVVGNQLSIGGIQG